MNPGTATVERAARREPYRVDVAPHAVVTQADTTIWISDELLADIRSGRERITGDYELNGDLISVGTPGEGVGRVTYRIIGRTPEHSDLHTAVRVDTDQADDRPTATPIYAAVREAISAEWHRRIAERVEDSPDGHIDALTDAVMVRLVKLST